MVVPLLINIGGVNSAQIVRPDSRLAEEFMNVHHNAQLAVMMKESRVESKARITVFNNRINHSSANFLKKMETKLC